MGAGCIDGGQAYHRSFSSTLDLQCAPCFLPLPRPSRRARPHSLLCFDTLPLLLHLTLLSGSLVYVLTLVDEMPGSRGLARDHMADDDYIDKGFLLAHGGVSTRVSAGKASVVAEAKVFRVCVLPLFPSTLLLPGIPSPLQCLTQSPRHGRCKLQRERDLFRLAPWDRSRGRSRYFHHP